MNVFVLYVVILEVEMVSFLNFWKRRKHTAAVRQWLNAQSDQEDAILYLIEKEMFENEVRDLAYIIPRYRNRAYFESLQLEDSNYSKRLVEISKPVNVTVPTSQYQDIPQKHKKHVPNELEVLRGGRQSEQVQPVEEDYTAHHVTKMRAIHHSGNTALESIILTDAKERDMSNLDLTCFDD